MENKDSKDDLGKKEKSKGLTELQLENLKSFLRKLNYTKEELIQLENLYNILKPHYTKEELVSFGIESSFKTRSIEIEDWFNSSKKSWGELFQYLINRIDEISYGRGAGLDSLISKIAYDLHIKFDKTISQGQAEAVLKRILDIKLSSTGRTQLYELRKKIRKYDKFLAYFREWEIYDFTFKIVIMGLGAEHSQKLLSIAPPSGKQPQRLTLGVEFYPKQIEISDKKVKLQLWNISTEKEFNFLLPTYYLGANGAIIVFDKSNRESFDLAKETYNELKRATNLEFELHEKKGVYISMPIILIGLGNEKKVTAEEGQTLAKEIGAYGYIEISETDTQNFENMFSSLSLGIITNYQNALKKYIRRYKFKIIVVGDTKVGKTSLIKQYTVGSFNKDYVKTIGAQFSLYDKEVEGDRVRISFWDISGGKEFHFLRESFFKESRAAIIVYSLGEDDQDRDSFNQISDWYERIKKFCGDIPIVILGNKADLVDKSKFDSSKIQEFVNMNNLVGHYITSAKTGKGIMEAFNVIIEKVYSKYKLLSAKL